MTASVSPTAPSPAGPPTPSEGWKEQVVVAVATVDDPEYPGVSIIDLGLLEDVAAEPDGAVTIGLVPTFSGCPALAMIAAQVASAVSAVPGVTAVSVRWLTDPVWTTERISARGRAALAEEFTVAVRIGDRGVSCPRCGSEVESLSMFGPSRCRSVSRCGNCAETVEVMRA